MKPSSSAPSVAPPEAIRTGSSVAALAQSIRDNLNYLQARFPAVATRNDFYMALAYTVRDRLLHRWIHSAQTYLHQESRTVCYLSAEFLIGPQLGQNLLCLGIEPEVRQALKILGLELDDLLEQEQEPGLGNGGLGRLAACFLDSMATLSIPAIGYGIRYEFGIFDQEIRGGWQIEMSDKWLRLGFPWEIARPEIMFDVKFGGHTESYFEDGRYRVRWVPDRVVRGVACDIPVLGYRCHNVNLLRLWKAEAAESFKFQAFNSGDYYGAVLDKLVSENITKVLYPNDESPQGKELRLQQQYFFASCALQDMLRIFLQRSHDLADFSRKFVVQLNDTHPAVAVAELMRLLVDEYQVGWDQAWEITRHTFAYTNHTLLPEALERWAIPLFGALLPRHLEIIYELNHRFLNDVRARFPEDGGRVARLSLIDESGPRYVRMANLACLGSQHVNGVAQLHSDLLKQGVLRDFYDFNPQQFTNVTNGVTPRRFLVWSNPKLAALITRHLGERWVTHMDDLRQLEPLAEDPQFRRDWRKIKLDNKLALAALICRRTGLELNLDSLFDVQVKRLHEYKRQHLNVLHIICLSNRLRKDPALNTPARTFIFGGKAAPGYYLAKLTIRLINAVADVVNNDPGLHGRLKVVFFPNFNVKNGQVIYPAAELSEQISTAGKEASGTGNMKFALNGALTIGTLDGANVEIRDHVGPENFFLFGLTTPEVQACKARGYRARDYYEANPELKEVIDQLASGFFSVREPDLFKPLVNALLDHDEYLALADFGSYVQCQERVSREYLDPENWTRKSIYNVARSGYFSSDRSVREYCERIWQVSPVVVKGSSDAL